jgi:transcriptional regulator with XRE-family HTH domain
VDFSGRLKMIIKESGLTREQFFGRLGISKSQLFNYLGGRSEPTISFFIKLKYEFPQVDLGWLINGEEEIMVGGPQIGRDRNKGINDKNNHLEPNHIRPNNRIDSAPINHLIGHIENILKGMTEDQQKDVLKYVEERKLLSDLMAEKK